MAAQPIGGGGGGPGAAEAEAPIGPDAGVDTLDEERLRVFRAFRDALPPDVAAACGDHTLLRFLRARDFSLGPATRMLLEDRAWRKEQRIDSLLTHPPARALETVRPLQPDAFFGFDRWGRPLYILQAGRVRGDEILKRVTMAEYLRTHLWGVERMLERARERSREIGRTVTSVALVVDLDGLSMDSRHCLKLVREVADCDEKHYPEILGATFVINAPSLFPFFWRVVSPMLDPHTASKVKVLTTDYRDALLRNIAPDQLPAEYGGTAVGVLPAAAPVLPADVDRRTREDARESMPLKQTTVAGGDKFVMDVTVTEGDIAGARDRVDWYPEVSWYFHTDAEHREEIRFSAVWRPASGEEPTVVVAEQLFKAHKRPVWSGFEAYAPGTLTLLWDNSYSVFSPSKTLTYAIRRTPAPPEPEPMSRRRSRRKRRERALERRWKSFDGTVPPSAGGAEGHAAGVGALAGTAAAAAKGAAGVAGAGEVPLRALSRGRPKGAVAGVAAREERRKSGSLPLRRARTDRPGISTLARDGSTSEGSSTA